MSKPGQRPAFWLLILLLFSPCLFGAAPAGSIKFAGYGPGAGIAIFASPLRGIYRFTNVNSKYNQPRTVPGGSNPHQGIDLDTGGKGEPLYPPCRGVVRSAAAGRGGNRILVIQLDWNNDGRLDNLYVTYMHLSYFLVRPGDAVDVDTVVGLSGGSGGYDPHLHFEINTNFDYGHSGEGTCWVSIPAYPYYRGIRPWNQGRDLDFIAAVQWRNNRYLSAVVYANDEQGYHPVQEGDVVLFYRTGTAPWAGPLALKKKGDLFSFDLAALHLSPGTTLDFCLRARRDDITPGYNCAFYPPKYYRPPLQPEGNDYIYESFSIRYY